MSRYSPVLRTRSRQTSESPLWESWFALFIYKATLNNRQKEDHGTARQGIIGESQSQQMILRLNQLFNNSDISTVSNIQVIMHGK